MTLAFLTVFPYPLKVKMNWDLFGEFNHVLENENMFAVMPGNLVLWDKVLCYYGMNSKECTAMKDGDHKNIDSQLLITEVLWATVGL